ncbi:hypothetical protein [Algoriphagus halophilus]|uniref:Tetratricopeptide repeat-containing protein n=1 Tax=Algoriphagus halophilus TaxID=226505 RepID=A0A1N6DG97_9BACT|nr:hypothetical protein [Algoriphagus halophilus]SIN69684.1 hypothetical protein SAMN05444394_0849 [Algoriphagus halophilus]
MNAAQFIELINKSGTPSRSDLLSLKKIQENFPYFQIPHVLAARYEYCKDPKAPSESLGYAAITSPNRIWLKELIEREADASPRNSQKEEFLPEDVKTSKDPNQRTKSLLQLGENLKGQKVEAEAAEKPKAKPVRKRRKSPNDDLIETIKKKEKKEILDSKKREQIDLIKAFSKKEIKLATIKEIEANQNNENLAASSTEINDDLLSESFAKLLVNQGKKPKAKKIYEKLMLKFPDKRSYFADLIEKLKE